MSPTDPIPVPVLDLRAGYLALKEEIDAAIARVLQSGSYILGPEVQAFEREFAACIGVGHAVGVASGTDALELALRACDVGPNDAVLTVSHTAVATVAAIEACGATPVFIDVESNSFTMDPGSLEEALDRWTTSNAVRDLRARVIVPVHLYGHPADMFAINEIAERHGLVVIEDCAQSHGARIDGRATGAWGKLAAFSFYPTKNLGALGDGGAVVTSDPALADKVLMLRQYGWRERYISATPGMNSRLDELQAAILRVKLRHLDAMNTRRRELASLYSRALSGTSLIPPSVRPGFSHVYHQYVVRTPRREALRERLRRRDIGTLVHYPVPIHRQPAYADRVALVAPLARTEALADEILSLPLYPELEPERVLRVAAEIAAWDGEGRP